MSGPDRSPPTRTRPSAAACRCPARRFTPRSPTAHVAWRRSSAAWLWTVCGWCGIENPHSAASSGGRAARRSAPGAPLPVRPAHPRLRASARQHISSSRRVHGRSVERPYTLSSAADDHALRSLKREPEGAFSGRLSTTSPPRRPSRSPVPRHRVARQLGTRGPSCARRRDRCQRPRHPPHRAARQADRTTPHRHWSARRSSAGCQIERVQRRITPASA
jgi:hypothetical protein